MSINIKKLSFTYKNQLFDNLEFEVNSKDKIGIIGETGSGKTTLLKIIMGLIPIQKGELSLFDKVINSEQKFHQARLQIGYLFQNSDDQLFSPTVIDDVIFGPLNQGLQVEEAQKKAKEALELVKMWSLKDQLSSKLSGGEKKLVALATILAMKPKLLLLDEPITGLDPNTKKEVIEIINNFDGPLVIISHDWNFLEQVTNKIFKLENKKLLFNGQMKIHQHTHLHPMGDVDHEHSKIEESLRLT